MKNVILIEDSENTINLGSIIDDRLKSGILVGIVNEEIVGFIIYSSNAESWSWMDTGYLNEDIFPELYDESLWVLIKRIKRIIPLIEFKYHVKQTSTTIKSANF